VIAHGAIGTNHVDRQHPPCTAAAALKESFASDGQPGSYTDIDHVDLRHLHRTAAGVSLDWELLA